ADRVRIAFALALNARLMQDMDKKTLTKPDTSEFVSFYPKPISLSIKLIHYHTILSYLETLPLPWDFETLYLHVIGFAKNFYCEDLYQKEVDLENFKLADVPLNLNHILPRTYYLKVLGLSQNASNNDARDAYKRLCLQHHPDRNKNNQEQAKEMFARLQIVAAALEL
ncbi:MAG: J domain-containing protein, partial [Vibrionaceae bacterium]